MHLYQNPSCKNINKRTYHNLLYPATSLRSQPIITDHYLLMLQPISITDHYLLMRNKNDGYPVM